MRFSAGCALGCLPLCAAGSLLSVFDYDDGASGAGAFHLMLGAWAQGMFGYCESRCHNHDNWTFARVHLGKHVSNVDPGWQSRSKKGKTTCNGNLITPK